MVLSIVLGLAVGVIGFLPLFAGLKLTKRVTTTSNLGYLGALLLGLVVSFVLLAAALFACVTLAREVAAPFACSVAGGLIVSAITYGIVTRARN